MKSSIHTVVACFAVATGVAAAAVPFWTPHTSPQSIIAGNPVSLNLVVSGLGNPPSVGSFDITVGFDPALLTPVSVDFGSSLGNIGALEALTDFQFSPGMVDLAEVSLLLNGQLDVLQSSSIMLAAINFQAITSGVANFEYLGGPIDDANGELLIGSKVPEPVVGRALPFFWESWLCAPVSSAGVKPEGDFQLTNYLRKPVDSFATESRVAPSQDLTPTSLQKRLMFFS